MVKGFARVLALTLAGALFFGLNMESQAAGLSDVLPTGGVSIALAQGTTLESMHAKNGQNSVALTSMVDENAVEEAKQVVSSVLEETFENAFVADADNYANVRSMPGQNGKVLGKLYDNAVGELLGEENGWYHIQSGNVTGYVRADFCVIGEAAEELLKEVGTRLAKVNCEGLYVRQEASQESNVLRMAALGDELLVLEETQEWIKVDVEEGFGWVLKEYVDVYTEYIHAESRKEERARIAKESEARERAKKSAIKKAASDLVITGDNEMGVAVAEYAIQFVGNPYVWGGVSLTDGADCSGFVMKVYENFGVELPHSSAADRKQGYAVKGGLKNAQPGDLICYSGHVAIYIGDGKIVHAASEKSGIKIGKADYRKILAVRRIF